MENTAEESSKKSPTKILWIIMLIPVGLIIGSITSTCQHLKHDLNKDDMAQYRVSEKPTYAAIADDMEKLFHSPDADTKNTIRTISSSLGINNYLKIRALNPKATDSAETLGYIDVVGKNKEKITAVVVELDNHNPLSRASALGIQIAVMKSVLGEKDLNHTLRFVFLPRAIENLTELNNILTTKKETINKTLIIRPNKGITSIAWERKQADAPASNTTVLTHKTIALSTKEKLETSHIEACLKATNQLRVVLLKAVYSR